MPKSLIRAVKALAPAASVALAGCWAYVSDVDLVGAAGVVEPGFEQGVYCPILIWTDFMEIDDSECDRIGWDARQARHYYAPAFVRWDSDLDRPAASQALEGFGVASIWLDVADLGRGLYLVQRSAREGEPIGRGFDGAADYVAFVVVAAPSGFALLPLPDERAYEVLAASHDVSVAPLEVEGVKGLRIEAGEPAAARALVRDAAAAWLDVRFATGRGFRQPPVEGSDIGPLYHVRLEALRAELPFEVAVESAMFEIEQQVRAAAVAR